MGNPGAFWLIGGFIEIILDPRQPLNASFIRKLRCWLGVYRPGKGCNYLLIDGNCPPVFEEGSTWYYTNISGTRIRHPSAYAKKGWSSLCYHSAICDMITVGVGWAIQHGWGPVTEELTLTYMVMLAEYRNDLSGPKGHNLNPWN